MLHVPVLEFATIAKRKLDRIQRWCEAYPVDVFPEPDIEEVRRLLGDGLLTRLSAHISLHVLNGIQKIACEFD